MDSMVARGGRDFLKEANSGFYFVSGWPEIHYTVTTKPVTSTPCIIGPQVTGSLVPLKPQTHAAGSTLLSLCLGSHKPGPAHLGCLLILLLRLGTGQWVTDPGSVGRAPMVAFAQTIETQQAHRNLQISELAPRHTGLFPD